MSYRKNKLTYRVFCSHSSDYPQNDLDKIKAVCSELSTSQSSADFEFQDMYTGQSSDRKTKESLLNDASRSDVFFRLLHDVYGEGTKDEYDVAKKKLGRDSVYTFIRTDSDKSKNLFAELKTEEGSGTIIDYSDLDYFKRRVSDELSKYRDARNKNRWWRRIIAAFVIIGLLYIFSDGINKLIYRKPQPDPIVPAEIEDKSRDSFNERIVNAEALLHQKKYSPARDSLNVLKGACNPKWNKERIRIDSLLLLIPSDLPPYRPEPPALNPPSDKPSTPVVEDNTYEIVGGQSSLRGYLSNSIMNVLPRLSKPSDDKKERWTITIKQDLSALEIPKIIESDEYQIEIEYGINVKDNLTGKVILENTVTTRGRSPASQEDAKKHSRQLAAQEIAEQIKQCIQ